MPDHAQKLMKEILSYLNANPELKPKFKAFIMDTVFPDKNKNRRDQAEMEDLLDSKIPNPIEFMNMLNDREWVSSRNNSITNFYNEIIKHKELEPIIQLCNKWIEQSKM